MASFPKYHELICDTYSPDFVAGPTSCTISTSNESRSRAMAGGWFFRSVETGTTANVNIITIQCVVGSPTYEYPNDVYTVDVTLTDPDGNTVIIPTFTQKYDNGDEACTESGVAQLKALINATGFIEMPAVDVQQPWDESTDAPEFPCLLTSFGPVTLSGGSGPPAGSSSIRTGPAYTLYHIGDSDRDQADGSIVTINALAEWDGTQWVDYPSTLYDPDNIPAGLCD